MSIYASIGRFFPFPEKEIEDRFACMAKIITEYPQFFTATCLEWTKLLQPDKYKDLIAASMKFLVEKKRAILYGFVIMINHIHIIWQMHVGIKRSNLQRDFLKFTAQKMKRDLQKNHPIVLSQFLVNAKDRKYQFWERHSLSIDIWSERVLEQKLKYLHENPVTAGLCRFPEEYKYSSALFYKTGIDNWGFLTHYRD
jgi:REP element-mobilizing transposase RayT